MFGPGRYVSDPTEGIVNVKDLPVPTCMAYDRNHKHTPCPRCGGRAPRHTSGQRLVHDLGDVSSGWPVDLLGTSSSHSCAHGQKPLNIDLSDVVPPGSHSTHRVIDLAVRVVGEDGLPYRPASGHRWRAPRGCVPFATLQHWVEAGGKTGARAQERRVAGVGAGGLFGVGGGRCTV